MITVVEPDTSDGTDFFSGKRGKQLRGQSYTESTVLVTNSFNSCCLSCKVPRRVKCGFNIEHLYQDFFPF